MRADGLELSSDGTLWVPIDEDSEVAHAPPQEPPPPAIGVRRVFRSVHEVLAEQAQAERMIGTPVEEDAPPPQDEEQPQGRPLTPVELRLVARTQEVKLTCPFCHDVVKEAEDTWARCASCETLYHGECWEILMDSPKACCATLGCTSGLAERRGLTLARQARSQRVEHAEAISDFNQAERAREERREVARQVLESVDEFLRPSTEEQDMRRQIEENNRKLLAILVALAVFFFLMGYF